MAVMTAAQGRFYLRGITGTGEDTDIDTAIARAESMIATWLEFPPVSESTAPTLEDQSYVLYLPGPGGKELQCPIWPIQSVTSLYDDPNRAYGSGTLIASTDYDIDKPAGKIILTESAAWGAFSSDTHRAIKLTVVAGWATIPADILHAVGLQLRHVWRSRDAVGMENVNHASGSSASFRAFTVLPEVKELLGKRRLVGGWL